MIKKIMKALMLMGQVATAMDRKYKRLLKEEMRRSSSGALRDIIENNESDMRRRLALDELERRVVEGNYESD